MTLENIIAGMQIIARHASGHVVSAGHDEIYCGSSSLPLTDEEKLEMERLGWAVDEDNEHWQAFV